MRKDNDDRNLKGKEIDDFLAQFDEPERSAAPDKSAVQHKAAAPDKSAAQQKAAEPAKGAAQPKAATPDKSAAKHTAAAPGKGRHAADAEKDQSPKKCSHDPAPSKGKDKKEKKDRKIGRKKSGKPKRSFKEVLDDLIFIDNPDYDPNQGSYIMKDGKKVKNSPRKYSHKKMLRNVLVFFAAILLVFFVYAFAVISTAPKIEPKKLYDSVAESSTVYDSDGDQVETVYYEQNRTLVKYKDMPPNLIDAFVSIEDKTFWHHHGFNWTRLGGAVLQSFTGSGRISGTSTITQQLARNVYLPKIKSQRSIKRKILEMYYAGKIESQLSKEQIIEAYLNTIYLGFGNYGVDAASHAYFSKDPKDLTLVECASLAALPQAPDSYALVKMVDKDTVTEKTANIITRDPDTYISNDASKNRRDLCLKLMLDQGYIKKSQFKQAYKKPLSDFINPTISSGANVNSYFSEYMIDQVASDLMKKYKISYNEAERMIYTGGLKIYSTLDSTAQAAIVKEFNNPSNFPYLVGIRKDGSGNIIDSYGSIMLYAYSNMFDSSGNFTLGTDECSVNKDGSVTIYRDKRLSIYTTKSNGQTDYSLEFKQSYFMDGSTLYTYPGGYINIPAKYKKLDKDNNLVISKEYFDKSKDSVKVSDGTVTITPLAYSLPEKVIQPQAAMAIVEVGTGQVKAMVGGRGTVGKRLYNRALSPRQPGSSIKPLGVYSAAIQKSFDLQKDGKTFPYVDYGHDTQGTKGYGTYLTAASKIDDEPMHFNGKSWPKNAGGGYSGVVTMRKALQMSINVVAVKIQMQVGNQYCADLIKKFGITTLETKNKDTNDLNTAALALGGMTHGVKPLEMAQAYATFPNGGVRQTSIAYTKVEDRDGKVILQSKSKKYKVLDEGVAFIMTDMLKSVVNNGLGHPASLSKVAAGGKTGTTSDSYDIWFDGFSPTYAAALWIGTDVNIQLSQMSSAAAALWGKIMRQIPNALKGQYKSMPANVVYTNGEYFTKGTNVGIGEYKSKKQEEEEAKKKAEEEAQQAADNANNDDGTATEPGDTTEPGE